MKCPIGRYLNITGLWKGAASAQLDDLKVNKNVKFYQENKAVATN